jgi:hypothetical protein
LKRPVDVVLAVGVCAAEWFRVLVLLFDGADLSVADFAGEVTNQQFWLYFGGARYCALN